MCEWQLLILFHLVICAPTDCLTDVRQSLATPKPSLGKGEGSGGLSDLLQGLQTSVTEQVKSVLVSLQVSYECK